MRKRKLLFSLFVTLLIVFWLVPKFPVQGETLPQGVTISVVHSEEVIVPVTAVPFTEGDTAFDVLQEVAEVDYEKTDYGPFITGINGVQPEGDDYWGFFINGQEAQVGAADYELQNGDHLLFKITSFPPETIKVTVSAQDLDGNDVISPVEVEIVNGATALDALVQAANENNIAIDVSVDSEWLTFLNDIDGQTSDASVYWASFINDEYMTTGLVQYMMQEGDHLRLQLEAIEAPIAEDESESKEPVELNEETIKQAITSAIEYLEANERFDWYGILALLQLGENLPEDLLQDTVQNIENQAGEYENVTDVAKHILIVTACGKAATEIEGINLIDVLVNHEGMTRQGNNGPIFALLALDSGNYEGVDDSQWNRDALLEFILDAQLEDGSWALTGDTGSADMTGLALAALAPYQDDEQVATAIQKAKQWIIDNMSTNGGFYDEYSNGYPAESIAQVMIGLIAIGEDPADETYTKNGTNLVQALLTFQLDGFRHLLTDEHANPMTTNQALLALTAFQKKVPVFDFSDYVQNKGAGEANPFTPVLIGAGITVLLIIVVVASVSRRRKART